MREIPFEKVCAWVFEAMLPFWAARGIYEAHDGFLEEVSQGGEPTLSPAKRLRTVCRQTYVFSHAALLGCAPANALSTRGYECLLASARLDNGGWARLLTREGAVVDPAPDLPFD